MAYVCSNPIVASDAAGTTVKSRLGARSPAPDPPLTGYPPAGGIGNPVERPPDDEPGNVGGGAGVSTDLWWDRPTMTGRSVATFLGIHRYFWVTGPHEYTFYQYVWDYFVIDPPPPGVSPGGSISSSRSPNGYVPDDGEQGKRGGHYPHQSRSGGSAELRDDPGKAYHGTGSNQSEANQSMIGTVYADWEHYVPGGFPAGTRSVTFVQAFVTYVIDLTVGRVVGWWEWSYSIRIDVGPPHETHWTSDWRNHMEHRGEVAGIARDATGCSLAQFLGARPLHGGSRRSTTIRRQRMERGRSTVSMRRDAKPRPGISAIFPCAGLGRRAHTSARRVR